MKRVKLIATIVAFVLIFSVIGFNVYAALLSQRSISNQIIFNTDKSITGIKATFHYREVDGQGNYLSWSEPLSTFETDNNESPEGEFNNQIWNNEYSKSPLPDINFNEHRRYLIKLVFTCSEDRYLKIEGFNLDIEKYKIVYSIEEGSNLQDSGTLTQSSFTSSITANREYTVSLDYEQIAFNKSINLINNLTISFVTEI